MLLSMESVEKKSKNWKHILGFGLFNAVFSQITFHILKYGFSLKDSLAISLTILLTFFVHYPLFFRRSINIWTKDKRQWTFLSYMSVIPVISVLLYFIVKIIWE